MGLDESPGDSVTSDTPCVVDSTIWRQVYGVMHGSVHLANKTTDALAVLLLGSARAHLLFSTPWPQNCAPTAACTWSSSCLFSGTTGIAVVTAGDPKFCSRVLF